MIAPHSVRASHQRLYPVVLRKAMNTDAPMPSTDNTAAAYSLWVASGTGSSTPTTIAMASRVPRSSQNTSPNTRKGPSRPTLRITGARG